MTVEILNDETSYIYVDVTSFFREVIQIDTHGSWLKTITKDATWNWRLIPITFTKFDVLIFIWQENNYDIVLRCKIGNYFGKT